MLQILIVIFFSFSTLSKERIVSTVPSLSEILYELDLSDEVVGVSKYCSFDEDFCKKDKVGTSLDISYEKILKLKASAVLLSSSTNKKQVTNLSRLNIRTILLEHDRLDDIYKSINILGDTFSKKNEADNLIKKINASLIPDNLEGRAKNVLFLISSKVKDEKIVKVQAAGSKNFYSDILKHVGMKNILESYPMSYPEVGREKLISLKYDYVVEIFGSHNEASLKEKRSAWKELNDSKEGSIRYVPLVGNYLFVPGPSVWKIAQELKNKVGKK